MARASRPLNAVVPNPEHLPLPIGVQLVLSSNHLRVVPTA